jgi:phospholipid/cholesterol/gamma-HCH transport system substrate-binding protein
VKKINEISLEAAVGAFMVLGLLCLCYLAINLGDVTLFGSDRLHLRAQFVSSSGLKEGAFVEVGGVRVGTVERIHVDYDSYFSVVDLALDPRLQLQEDAIASIRTSGIIGDKFVKITPGGSDQYLAAGGEILETESSISIEELISKYIFESDDKK